MPVMYKPTHETTPAKQIRERLANMNEMDRNETELEAKKLVKAMHNRGSKMFGITSAYELLQQLYRFQKAVELDLPPDLRKKRTLIGLAESVNEPS